jgi:hypothetical protein
MYIRDLANLNPGGGALQLLVETAGWLKDTLTPADRPLA